MAIAYTTGTINQPDAGSVGLAMVEKIRDDVIAHAAWDLVEEFTPASGAVRWYVFKCLSAVSGLPSDFYVIIGRTLSNGELRAFACEEYTSGSHSVKYYSPYGYSNNFTFDSSGRWATEYSLSTAVLSESMGIPGYTSWAPSGTSTKWWLIVDNDTFTVAFNGPSNGFFHIGAYTPITQLPILLPVQTIGYNTNQSRGMITRNPALADILYRGCGLCFNGGEGGSITGQSLGFCADLRYNDKLQSGQRPVAEAGMNITFYTAGDQSVCGYILGKQKRMRWTVFQVPTGMAFGDAYAMGDTLWVPFRPDDQRMWNTGWPA